MDSSDKRGLAIILTDHQPVYLPWLGLFHKIAIADKFCCLDNVQYSKTDWTNRNKVKTPSGAVWLTVPVYTKGHFKKTILEIEINNDVPWRRKHWNTVYLSYKKSKHFNTLLNLEVVQQKHEPIENNTNNDVSFKKIGRNEQCPCNSGKKYKHCHGSL